MRARALLPYSLNFVGERRIEDPELGVLEMSMTGDLEGFSRFSIEEWGQGSRIVFEEQVLATKSLLRRPGSGGSARVLRQPLGDDAPGPGGPADLRGGLHPRPRCRLTPQLRW